MTNNINDVEDNFIAQWGTLGSSWGINKTMAQIHALLLIKPDPLTTDQIMDELSISRGNAHTNIKQLIDWGLLMKVIKKGERKELFIAEKDPWKMFCTITQQRKRREMEPLLNVLKNCTEDLNNISSNEAKRLHKQLNELTTFVNTGVSVMDKVSNSKQTVLTTLILKLLSK